MKPCMVCHIFRAEIFCTGRVVAQWPSLQRKQALALREMANLGGGDAGGSMYLSKPMQQRYMMLA